MIFIWVRIGLCIIILFDTANNIICFIYLFVDLFVDLFVW